MVDLFFQSKEIGGKAFVKHLI